MMFHVSFVVFCLLLCKTREGKKPTKNNESKLLTRIITEKIAVEKRSKELSLETTFSNVFHPSTESRYECCAEMRRSDDI